MLIKLIFVLFFGYSSDNIELMWYRTNADKNMHYTLIEVFKDSVENSERCEIYPMFSDNPPIIDYRIYHEISLMEAVVWRSIIESNIKQKEFLRSCKSI